MFQNKVRFSLNVKLVNDEKVLSGMPKKWSELNESVIKKSHKNLAIICGEVNNIVVIDFDEQGMQYFNQFENIMDTYIETSTRGFKHAYFLYDKDLKNHDKNIKNNFDIDILSNGSFCILGKENNNKEISLIPKELKEFLNNVYLNINSETHSETYTNTSEEINNNINNDINNESYKKIHDLVKIIDVNYSKNRDDWVKIGMCIKQLVNDEDEAFDIWNDFSKLCKEKYNLKENKKQWDSFKNTGSFSIKTLFHYTKENKKEMKEWNKLYKENKTISINKVVKLNKFDLDDDYCYCTLKDYIFENIFEDINSAIEYLELNLYRVCVRVNDYMITKQPMDDFNNIHKVEAFSKSWRLENLVKYYYYNEKTDSNKLIQVPLKDFLEQYPHLINSFYKINTEFISEGQTLNNKEFYITEQFKAKYIENIDESHIKQIQPLFDMIMIVYCNGDKNLYDMLMMLFSFWVCNPNEKSGKCLILAGKQGTGKSTIIEYFMDFIFGNKICMMLKGFKELLSEKKSTIAMASRERKSRYSGVC